MFINRDHLKSKPSKMKKSVLIIALALIAFGRFYAQTGIGTTSPDAALHVSSTTSGVLIPKYTSSARTALSLGIDQDGLVVYDTTVNCLFTYKFGTPPVWNSYCNKAFAIYAINSQYTILGQTGVSFKARSKDATNLPLIWSIDSVFGDVSGVTITADAPSTTATVRYNVPTTRFNNGKAVIVLKATDAIGQIQFTSVNLNTSELASITPLACNGDLELNNLAMVNTKVAMFAMADTAYAYRTYISPGNAGNLKVTASGQNVVALAGPGTTNVLRTWTTATGVVNVNPPAFTLSNPAFNGNPTLTFDSANTEALGIVTSNTGGPFKLAFLASVTGGGASACVLSASPRSNLGSNQLSDSSWQISRASLDNFFIFRVQNFFSSRVFEKLACPACDAGEVAFSTWDSFADGKPHLVVVDYDGTTIKGYFDGDFVFEVSPNATRKPTGRQFRLGVNRGSNSFINCTMAEMIIGNSSMTSDELFDIQGYFLCKYGLDASLLEHASPFSIANVFYDRPSQFELQVDQFGKERVYDKKNKRFYPTDAVPTPGLGNLLSPSISIARREYISNVQPGPSTKTLTLTKGDGTTSNVTVP